ncbi:MAG TPA: methylated-DNA--[protein]-cysteine S-methyltransferase [Thermoanaerobaculia bacterium]|jgi:methylated-DNA-[protein]-cysteine S-methyltransferase|nr:methylated-DNA--[protein]-cysteine S-methyltransferase [Thermoanaerobaculia bacterium]
MTSFWEIPSPAGPLLLSGDEQGLRGISFQGGPHAAVPAARWTRALGPFESVITQLEEYFAGARRRFELTLAPEGSPFQREVWTMLRRIPYGETTTYSELARRMGRSGAARAVGAANGRNPIPIVIPCHRVVGADGSLTGFGGGLDVKRRLLSLEARFREPSPDAARDLFDLAHPPAAK